MLRIILLLLIISTEVSGQNYFIYFKDKGGQTSKNAYTFLSTLSIERRQKNCILIDETDYPIEPIYLNEVAKIVSYKTTSKWLNGVYVSANTTQINELKKLSCIKKISPVGNWKCNLAKTDRHEQSGRCDYFDLPQRDMLDADMLHYAGYTGKDILIAVLDDGFRGVSMLAGFSALFETNRIKSTRNFFDGSNEVMSVGGHGTAVLSNIAGQIPLYVEGTGYGASFLLARTEIDSIEDAVEMYQWIAAAEWADSAGAQIISTSLGYTQFDEASQNYYYADMDGKTTPISIAAQLASEKGILVLNSAGNEGTRPWHFIGAPADAAGVLTVGGVDANRKIADFSSRGPSWDGRIKPDVCAQAVKNVSISPGGDIYMPSGTSFSCPTMSGFAACLMQAAPHKTAKEIYSAIVQSSHQYEHPDNDYGYGIPSGRKAYQILTGLQLPERLKCTNLDENGILVFPNPATTEINIAYSNRGTPQQLDIILFDMLGRVITATSQQTLEGFHQYRLQTSDDQLLKGIYFIRVAVGEQILLEQKLLIL
jgi:subtilisin family serine protease